MTIRFYGLKSEHGFLSNFYPYIFKVDDRPVLSVEHSYQAAKATTVEDQELIFGAPTAAAAKDWGQKIKVRADWDQIVGTPELHAKFQDEWGFVVQLAKDFFMFKAVTAKFQVPELRQKLLATGDEPLVEASPTDYYWGAGKIGTGQNKLGRMLMLIRARERYLNTTTEPTEG
jgi:ribA/ribD-fused uncharacterized protein